MHFPSFSKLAWSQLLVMVAERAERSRRPSKSLLPHKNLDYVKRLTPYSHRSCHLMDALVPGLGVARHRRHHAAKRFVVGGRQGASSTSGREASPKYGTGVFRRTTFTLNVARMRQIHVLVFRQ